MSLYVLDTDVVTLLRGGHPQISQRVSSHAPADLAITIITVEEQLTGWYARIRQARKRDELARVYQLLTDTVGWFTGRSILSYTEPAILRYEQLRTMRLNIGGSDLRIAAIALEVGAIVVTRNLRDFQRIPNLVVEDWSV
ncbi:MAG TPA: type II toxin-antitoxin system VapC family toxin [Gemmataceae bacterium]|nr:type II toxin-antitoxin system VapC family toxin [Gemmataceae bacterium]